MSGQSRGSDLDLSAVNGVVGEGTGVAHAGELVAFAEAVMGADDAALAHARAGLREVLSDAAFVDACAVVGGFNIVDRIADSTGIPLDDGIAAVSADLRGELELARFASAANTPGARE